MWLTITQTAREIEGGGGGGGRRGEELFTYQYPLKIQACPPKDQRMPFWSRVLGQEARD